MRIIKNLISILVLASLAILIFAKVKIMVVIAFLLVGVWLYLDFAFSNNDIDKDFTEDEIIKRGDFDDESKAEELTNGIKISINSVCGLTSAKFDKPFKDPRDKDNKEVEHVSE